MFITEGENCCDYVLMRVGVAWWERPKSLSERAPSTPDLRTDGHLDTGSRVKPRMSSLFAHFESSSPPLSDELLESNLPFLDPRCVMLGDHFRRVAQDHRNVLHRLPHFPSDFLKHVFGWGAPRDVGSLSIHVATNTASGRQDPVAMTCETHACKAIARRSPIPISRTPTASALGCP